MAESPQSLTIVIPALDEEEAIGSTVERCLAARAHIRKAGSVVDVEIIVVSDGSTDRTEKIARGYDEVTVLAFERNRGYGAAIKAGFAHGRGTLVGFLDADGTCDPLVFAELCRALSLSVTGVALLLCAAMVAEHISALAYRREAAATGITALVARLFTPRGRWIGGLTLLAGSLILAWPGIVEYLREGQVFMHWSRAVMASLLLVLAGVLSITTFLLKMISLIGAQLRERATVRPPDRIRPAKSS